MHQSGLRITNLQFLGVARTMFETDPLDHGKGTDTLNLMYLAKGEGEVTLDEKHRAPLLFTREECQNGLRDTLHPYVVEMMDAVFAH